MQTFSDFPFAFTGLEAEAVNERQAPLRVTSIEMSRIIRSSLDLEREKDVQSFASHFTYVVCGAGTSEEEAQILFQSVVRSTTAVTMSTQTRYFAARTTIMSATWLT
jgi:hypothetical protein